MANDNIMALKSLHTKKEMKQAVAGKIESVLTEMKNALGEKKFHRRVRKAAKLLMQGIHSEEVLKKAKKKAAVNKAASIKKTTAKKVKNAKSAKKVKAVLPEIFNS